jgi:Asp-tRNA(Asn)/Glu-tRNA(Gln) amidotransferase A subunit family amidase
MVAGVDELLADFERLRQVKLDNATAPALTFFAVDPSEAPNPKGAPPNPAISYERTRRPRDEVDLTYASIRRQAAWLRSRELSAVELTRAYLDRLKRHDGKLEAVITLLEEQALGQARQADAELASGQDRGPLHGIPWGAKDLLSAPPAPTTWGARGFEQQVRRETATVISRLEAAGAILIAKLALGALAWGDVWYGGQTRNPWRPEQGSSGSSSGPAAATSAGLVSFAIGSETWGSIVSPCTRCGTSGLRPTFGRVSRHGAMALSWSMDKLGPLARSVDDCALVLGAIQGPDGRDPTVLRRPYTWPPSRDPRQLRVGYVRALFEEEREASIAAIEDPSDRERASEWADLDRATLATLRELEFSLTPIELPEQLPVSSLSFILTAEAATAFDALTREGRDDLLVRQVEQAWPNVLRQGQLIPAVEYLRANRIRTLLLEAMERALANVDVYVCPTFGGDHLLLTNLTGHPSVVLPNGFRASDGTPTSITFGGRLFGEAEIASVAVAYQEATGLHLQRPPDFA